MRSVSLRLLTAALLATPAAFAEGFVLVSVEQNNSQISASDTMIRDYTAFATVEEISAANSATVSVNGGSPISLVAEEGGYFEASQSSSSLSALTNAFPLGGTYTFNVTGTPNTTSTITGPGGAFTDRRPANPVFTLGGVTGVWSTFTDTNGSTRGRFDFNPTGVTSFTVSLNALSTPNNGSHYGYFAQVGSVNGNTYTFIDEIGDGPLSFSTPPTPTVLTFTNGLASNAGDDNPLTYGFSNGSFLEVEGGFFNIVGLSPSGLGDSSEKGFLFGNVTSFLLVADTSVIPEPSAYGALLGGFALAGAVLRRRRR
jgi:hypothetical protein